MEMYVDVLMEMVINYIHVHNSQFQFDIKTIHALFQKHKEDIALCIMSLLQDVVIDIGRKKRNGKVKRLGQGKLFLRSVNGTYGLYCRVFESDIGLKVAKMMNLENKNAIIDVPVAFSQVKDIDGIIYDNQYITHFVETYRDLEDLLRVREARWSSCEDSSPGFKISTKKNYDSLVNGTFTEDNIKELMIDLRERTKYLKRELNSKDCDNNSLIKFVDDFNEISDFIGHPNRDKGLLAKRIKKYISASKEKYPKGIPNNPDIGPKDFVMDVYSIITGLIIILENYLTVYGINVNKEDSLKILKFRDDIALCIISLLQEYSIDLSDDPLFKHSILIIKCYGNTLHLCLKTFLPRSDPKLKLVDEHDITVIYTNVENTDGLVIENSIKEKKKGKIIETYRNSNGVLKAKFKE